MNINKNDTAVLVTDPQNAEVPDAAAKSTPQERKESQKSHGCDITRDEPLSEAIIDATLSDTFPASDPPAWTLGRYHYKEPRGLPVTLGAESSKANEKEETVMRPNIDLSDEQREGVVKILSALLSDEYVLYTKTRNYHWNVVGPQFHSLHKFFEEQYKELDEIVDEVAERIRSLGGWSLGTLSEFLKHTRLKEQPGQYPNDQGMIADLLDGHEAIIRHLRIDLEICADKYRDIGTNDFLTGLMERHEKMAWMLRALLEGK